MSPEMFKGESGAESDIWAVGIITFECLAGVVPFHAGDLQGLEAVKLIASKVQNWQEWLVERLDKSRMRKLTNPAAERFIAKVVTARERRLSIQQCRYEEFFRGINFAEMHLTTPPFVPEVSAPDDTAYFDQHACRVLPSSEQFLLNAKDRMLDWATYDFDQEAHALCHADLDYSRLLPAEPDTTLGLIYD